MHVDIDDKLHGRVTSLLETLKGRGDVRYSGIKHFVNIAVMRLLEDETAKGETRTISIKGEGHGQER